MEINDAVTYLDWLLSFLSFSIRSILQPKKSHADLKNKSLKLRLSSLIVAREGIEPPSASGGYEPKEQLKGKCMTNPFSSFS